jgi:hypothetical protein
MVTGARTATGGTASAATDTTGGANTAMTAGNPAGTGTTGGAPVVVPGFALNPGTALGSIILDYLNNKAHKWMYTETIKSLYSDPKDKFDLLSDQIQTFLVKTSIRLQMVGNLILMILVEISANVMENTP